MNNLTDDEKLKLESSLNLGSAIYPRLGATPLASHCLISDNGRNLLIGMQSEDGIFNPQEFKQPIHKLRYLYYMSINTGKIKKYDLSNLPASVKSTSLNLGSIKFKIKDSKLSGTIFGYSKIKKSLEGSIVTNVYYEVGQSIKLGKSIGYFIVSDPNTGRNFKFCTCDLEIVNINIKSYKEPKDRNLRVKDKVLIKGDVNKTEYIILNVKHNLDSKRLFKNSETRQLSVVTISNNNKVLKTYAKNIKKL